MALSFSMLLVSGCDPAESEPLPGDCPAFAQIAGATFTAASDSLEWTLEVEELPAELTFNQAGVPLDVLEYRWGVHIDVDGDGAEDYLVAVSHYRSGDEVTGAILSNTQHDLWQTEGALGSQVAGIAASISGSTFTFAVERTADPGLDAVGAGSKLRFETQYHDGTELCGDEQVGL